MKVKAAIKKVKTYFAKQGIDIDVELVGHRWSFQHNGYVGSFLANGRCDDEDQMDADAHNFHIRRCDDHSDLQSDYHAGSFRDNITQVCESLLPSPPKFPAGSLVRGRDNKRANRQGFAGLVGLVTQPTGHGGYCYVEWMGPNAPKSKYKVSYSERDLELAS
ncbi:MAG: hypothetical protein CMF96_12475 [Candidatus Marinimicrobia bacterium]|nr:hypothetical protein [Candidatus Neomarinimicrobiota bacterium]OUV96649.1 MAG: hypothetical protein CBD02_04670 [Candidatus Pelagibacter sp. TMED142]